MISEKPQEKPIRRPALFLHGALTSGLKGAVALNGRLDEDVGQYLSRLQTLHNDLESLKDYARELILIEDERRSVEFEKPEDSFPPDIEEPKAPEEEEPETKLPEKQEKPRSGGVRRRSARREPSQTAQALTKQEDRHEKIRDVVIKLLESEGPRNTREIAEKLEADQEVRVSTQSLSGILVHMKRSGFIDRRKKGRKIRWYVPGSKVELQIQDKTGDAEVDTIRDVVIEALKFHGPLTTAEVFDHVKQSLGSRSRDSLRGIMVHMKHESLIDRREFNRLDKWCVLGESGGRSLY